MNVITQKKRHKTKNPKISENCLEGENKVRKVVEMKGKAPKTLEVPV